MAEAEKSPVPLQAVVSVICDALADLQPVDQARALEAVRITLGVSQAAPTAPSVPASVASVDALELVSEVCRTLRPEQLGVLSQTLDMSQKIMVMEILNSVSPAWLHRE